MVNGVFYSCLSEPQGFSAWWKETAQTRIRFSLSLLLNRLEPQSSKAKLLPTHNANRHCRVRFCTFVGQPLSKQMYNKQTSQTLEWLQMVQTSNNYFK